MEKMQKADKNPVFRRAVPADAEAIANIERLSFPKPWSLDLIETSLSPGFGARFVVAEFKGEVVAYIGARCIADSEYEIANVAVLPRFRRRGIASGLLAALIDMAEAEGAYDISLEVRPSNEAALTLYDGFGFRAEGRRKGYYSDGEDALIMWRRMQAPDKEGI